MYFTKIKNPIIFGKNVYWPPKERVEYKINGFPSPIEVKEEIKKEMRALVRNHKDCIFCSKDEQILNGSYIGDLCIDNGKAVIKYNPDDNREDYRCILILSNLYPPCIPP